MDVTSIVGSDFSGADLSAFVGVTPLTVN